MSATISASTPFHRHYLIVDSDRVEFCQGGILTSARQFKLAEILCLLLAPNHRLCFQVGQEVFSIPTTPEDSSHQAAITTLLEGLNSTLSSDQEPLQSQTHFD